MAIKLEINMTNKWLYSLIAVGVLLALGVGVYAYQSDMRAGNPSVMGHSAGEIYVEFNGAVVSLQTALDNLSLQTALDKINLNCLTVRAYENGNYFIIDGSGIVSDIVNFTSQSERLMGVTGKNDWIITGCTHGSYGDHNDIDFYMFNNGCFFDTHDGTEDENLIDARFCKISY